MICTYIIKIITYGSLILLYQKKYKNVELLSMYILHTNFVLQITIESNQDTNQSKLNE